MVEFDFDNLPNNDDYFGKRAINTLVKDINFLTERIKDKNPEEINFDEVKGYLLLLANEAERIQCGIYSSDNSLIYTSDAQKITFTNKNKTK